MHHTFFNILADKLQVVNEKALLVKNSGEYALVHIDKSGTMTTVPLPHLRNYHSYVNDNILYFAKGHNYQISLLMYDALGIIEI